MVKVSACTVSYHRRTNVLISEAYLAEAFDPQNIGPKTASDFTKFQAIWDTGATHTIITENVIQSCGLKPIGIAKVHTPNGEMQTPTFLVSIGLPNNVCFPQLRVSRGTLKDADVLIGMDIIGQGDFVVTNKDDKTTVSFRMPSIECIDFVKQQPPGSTPLPSTIPIPGKVGRNDPCPCGSGKKYKKCCGK